MSDIGRGTVKIIRKENIGNEGGINGEDEGLNLKLGLWVY